GCARSALSPPPRSCCGGETNAQDLLGCFVLVRVEDVRQAVDLGVPRRVGVADGIEVVPLLDRPEDRGRVVLRVIEDLVPAQERRDDQPRNPGAWAPLVVRPVVVALAGRIDVIPLTD